MVRINLLPHREQKRQARQRQFVSLAIGLAVLGLAIGRSGARRHRRADRQPEQPQHAAEDRDRQARRADQGDRQAARADAGAAGAQADRRDAAGQPYRGGASARPAGPAAARRAVPEVGEADRGQGDADRLRAVQRARLDADAQHRKLAVADHARAGRDQVGAAGQAEGQRVHPESAGEAARGRDRRPGSAACGARARRAAAPPLRQRGRKA